MFLKVYALAAVMLICWFCHCEAGQCTITERGVVKVNITCSSGCCLDGSGVRCCGDTPTTNNNKMIYSGVASPELNMYLLLVFACLAMLAVPRPQW